VRSNKHNCLLMVFRYGVSECHFYQLGEWLTECNGENQSR